MVTIKADEISNIVCEHIKQYNREVKIVNTGTVLQVGDEIARIHGLDEVMTGELIEFEEGAIEGSFVKTTRKITQILVSEAYLGRVINALAKPIDSRGEILAFESRLIESPTPGIISRCFVYEPIQIGLIAIDLMIPIGRSQRELIIGDRKIGKIKGQSVICVYVAIGQKASFVAQVVTTFQERGAMEYTIVVAETADSPATLHYLAPYIGAALAEYFMYRERHTLIIYDDLSKAAKSSSQLGEGREFSAYIPTNVISITDGQIFLSANLFNTGIRIAINRDFRLQTPLTVAEQVSTIYTGTNGYLDSLEIGQARKFLVELRTYLKMNKPQFQEIISFTKTFTEEADTLLKDAIQDQMERFRLQEQL
ncbi:hypothetical protein ES288_D08G122900v1 [Gossypium darwinii]|uniref:ATP synthase subunit alpha, mitochondrial n=1 Tax=Gossypium darwinii TaxID=34276 RepID=A0A5D2BNS3_GOSDA|nr:hypothetical protein ES288_D08G122900v1 [Gossypium darwinii]